MFEFLKRLFRRGTQHPNEKTANYQVRYDPGGHRPYVLLRRQVSGWACIGFYAELREAEEVIEKLRAEGVRYYI